MKLPTILVGVVFASLYVFVTGHVYVEDPRQRGILMQNPFTKPPPIKTGMPKSTIDWKCHFPSGDKSSVPGSGKKSQEKAGKYNWTPYEPWKRGFVFRAGVCGDLPGPKGDHMRGGKYYYPPNKPYIVKTYQQGHQLWVTFTLIAHHNGFLEMTVCDVKKCGGEISEACLRNRNVCRKLERTWDKGCETGKRQDCGPIDPMHPTRWYLPCKTKEVETMKNIKFKLPADMSCEHCVAQFYYTSANSCNPPGLVEYFRGPKGPWWWGDCPGQGDAKGGYRPPWTTCGGKDFSEEYYMCSDIRITPRAGMPNKPPAIPPPKTSKNPITGIWIRLNGQQKHKVANGKNMWLRYNGEKVSFLADTTGPKPKWVHFTVESKTGTERQERWKTWGPYRTGDVKRPITGRRFFVQATAETQDGKWHFFSVTFQLGNVRN